MTFMELMATLSLDKSEYDKGIDDAKSGVQALGSVVGKVASVGFKALTAAVTAAATGVAALTKSAVQNYAEYEQLVGGIKTLFGTGDKSLQQYADSVGKTAEEAQGEYNKLLETQKTMLDNASNAYKTAGLSANEYMDTAIGFSGALLKSLGGDTEKAATQTQMAITDMADQANKYGKTVQEISDTYTSLARGNTQTLDNLFGGMFAGTKEGLQEMLTYAENYRASLGETVSYSADSYADIVSAIHDVSKATGVAGTTSQEAATTIQGSLGMMKSAWENLVTGIADKDADLNQLMQNVVYAIVGTTDESGKHINGFIDNIIPVITNALESIGTLVQELVPKALQMLPTMLEDVLPKLTTAATDMVQGLINSITTNMSTVSKVLNQLIKSIVKLFPGMVKLGGELISTFASAIISNLDSILSAASDIMKILLKGLSEHSGDIVNAAVQIIEMLAGFFTKNIDLVVQSAILIVMGIAQGLMDNLDVLLTAAITIITSLGEALISNLPLIIDQIPLLVQALVDSLVKFLPQMVKAWVKLMDCLEIALPQIVDAILAALPKLMDTLVNYWLGDGFQQTFRAAVIMFGALTKALIQIAASLVASVGMFVRNIGSTISGEASNLMQAGATWFGGLVTAIANKISDVRSKVSNMVSTVASTVRGAFSNLVSSAKTWGLDLLSNFISGIKQKFNDLKNAVVGAGQIVANNMKHSHPKEGPMADDYTWMPDMMDLFIEGIEDNENRLRKTVTSAFDFKDAFVAPDTGSQTSLVTPMAQTRSATNSDLDELLSNLSINLYNTTEIDGQAIKKDSYKYTVTRMGDETRAVKVARGGFF